MGVTVTLEKWMIQQTRQAPQFPLRLPDKLRAQVKASAAVNGRSMNSEIVYQLTHAFERSGKPETEKADAA